MRGIETKVVYPRYLIYGGALLAAAIASLAFANFLTS